MLLAQVPKKPAWLESLGRLGRLSSSCHPSSEGGKPPGTRGGGKALLPSTPGGRASGLQADLGEIAGPVPDPCPKVNLLVSQCVEVVFTPPRGLLRQPVTSCLKKPNVHISFKNALFLEFPLWLSDNDPN